MSNKEFHFDLNRCTGCGACVVACKIENWESQTNNWRQIHHFNTTLHPEIPHFSLSLACNHCNTPTCLTHCPAKAISKDPVTGTVTVNRDLCMGCKYCTWACPYDAPQFDHTTGTIEKCDFCTQRQLKGETTACAQACPVNALKVQDMSHQNDTERENNQNLEGFTNANIEPSISFKHLRHTQRVPDASNPPETKSVNRLFPQAQKTPAPKISLKVEWTLLVFTSIAYILVALFTASLLTPLAVNPYLFLACGAMAMTLSTVHLGKKLRAYRAIMNVGSSWLSREILLFSGFLALVAFRYLFQPGNVILGWVIVLTGFLSLFAVDRLYQVAMQVSRFNFHSAQTLFNGLFLAGILTQTWPVYAGAGLVKLFLYIHRKWLFRQQHQKVRPLISMLRIGIGFLLPVVVSLLEPAFFDGYILLAATIAVITGELIDRTEFYDELDIITPAKQIQIDLMSIWNNTKK